MKKQTRKLLLCFGMLFSLHSASTGAQEKFMLLKLNDAETISVNLSKIPQYWLKGDCLFLRTSDQVVQYNLSQVQEIVFQDSEYASVQAVRPDEVSIYPTLATDYVFIRGGEKEEIRIITSEGREMPVLLETQDDGYRLDVGGYPIGIYQLLYGSKTFKFIKGQNLN